MADIQYIAPGELRPHEGVDEARVRWLVEKMRTDGVFHPPLLVDGATRVILDGHHRWRAACEMGMRVVPCYCIDYRADARVRVQSRRPDIMVTKDDVIEVGLSGRTYPKKTTRHFYHLPDSLPVVPLERLFDDSP